MQEEIQVGIYNMHSRRTAGGLYTSTLGILHFSCSMLTKTLLLGRTRLTTKCVRLE